MGSTSEREVEQIKSFLGKIILFINEKSPSKKDIAKKKVEICRELDMKRIPTDIELLLNAETKDLDLLKKFLLTKPSRTASGVAVVAVMSKPGKCPHGKCIYCPGGMASSFGDVPQSYTGNEPATMRGIRNDYDSYLQVMNRLEQYVAIGQSPEKVELIILGGTFLAFDNAYQVSFIRDVYQAMNDFSREFYVSGNDCNEFNIVKFKEFFELPGDIKNKNKTDSIKNKLILLKKSNEVSLEQVQGENETSRIRCVGMTMETKPDWGFVDQGNKMLDFGCTRVELGIQSLNEKILWGINRGHTLEDAKRSIRELKDLGFKLNFHMMPGLPGSNKEQDIGDMRELFENPDFRPDMLKIYPTMVMPGTILYEMYKKGEYKTLEIEDAVDIISEGLRFVPRYCRVMRIQRDIPAKFAEIAISKNNLRQLVSEEVKRKGFSEQDIRAREIGREEAKFPFYYEIIKYDSSLGSEHFISLVDANDRLLGFIRLRVPSQSLREEITQSTVLVRELHVYGRAVPLKAEVTVKQKEVQHRGYGKMLLAKAEEIVKELGKDRILVISGVGAREYYKKLGYKREGPYMAKVLL